MKIFLRIISVALILIIARGCTHQKSSDKPQLFQKPKSNAERLCLIDIGPLNSDIFRRMLSENRLPNIQKLLSRGRSIEIGQHNGRFINSAAASSEILTGEQAGKNGIATAWWGADNGLGFMSSSWEDLTAAPLWTTLSRNAVSSLFINWPLTHPAPNSPAVIISDRFLMCPDEAIYPPELKKYLTDNGILPGKEGLDSQLKDLVSPQMAIMKADIEALNRFLNFPLSERNLDEMLAENVDPSPEQLQRSFRMLSWELRKDRTIFAILAFLNNNYPLPEFVAIRSGALEVAQICFMRYHFARGFNITPMEMERFGSIVERCYEYEDEFVGKLLKILSRDRKIILFSDYQLEPATSWEEINPDDSLAPMTIERGHPVGMRLNPADMANELNVILRLKMDVILKPPQVWPLYPLSRNEKAFDFKLIPESVGPSKIKQVTALLSGIIDESGSPLFSEVALTDSTPKTMRLELRTGVRSSDLFDAQGSIVSASEFLTECPQVSSFPAPGSTVIASPDKEFNGENWDLKTVTGMHQLILRGLGLSTPEPEAFSEQDTISLPHEKPCDNDLGYCLRALGYLK